MKRNRLHVLLAATCVALLALPAFGKIVPSAEKPTGAQTETAGKYTAMVGFGYTSINQVNNSRYGLMGINGAVSRDYGRYFAVTADGAYYKWPMQSCNSSSTTASCNPGDPSVWEAFVGPELHAELYGRYSAFVHGLIGVAHTGGEDMNPSTSLAGGFGLGIQYKWNSRIALRLSGDNIMASFSLRNANAANGYSAHRTSNGRAALGVVYRF